MSDSILDATLVQDGQRVVATIAQTGEMIESNGVLDANCIVQTENGPQKCVKTFPLGAGGGKPEYVDTLPETGQEGVLYMVNSGVTRDGYAIFQMFAWHNNDWVAIGAFDVGIDPTGIVYEKSFDTTTNTWTVTVS